MAGEPCGRPRPACRWLLDPLCALKAAYVSSEPAAAEAAATSSSLPPELLSVAICVLDDWLVK